MKVNITTEQIINALDGTENHGDYWTALCPAHDDTKFSLSITEDEGKPLVHCFAGCKQMEVWKACVALAQSQDPEGSGSQGRVKVQKAVKPFTGTTAQVAAFKQGLSGSEKGKAYVTGRGITLEVAQSLDWGFAPTAKFRVEGKQMDFQDDSTWTEKPAITTPQYRGSVLVGLKYRSIADKDFFQMPGSSLDGLYGARLLRSPEKSEGVLVLEGPEDVGLAISHGFNAVGLISAGSKLSEDDIATLTKYQKIYLLGDNDAPGQKAMDKLAARFPKAQTLRISLGEHKDVGDLWKSDPLNFKENLQASINAPLPEKVTVEFIDEYDLEKRFFIIGDGNAEVWSETLDSEGNIILSHQSQSAFKARYNHKKVEIIMKNDDGTVAKNKDGSEKKVLVPIAALWLANPNRPQFSRLDFYPEKDLGKYVYNLWRGFAVKPVAGDCSLYLAHVRDNICNGDETLYQFVISWLAYKIQHPGERGHTALVLRGREGVGKNVFADAFKYLFGPHGVMVTKQEQLTGRFNGYLQYQCVVIANESFFAGSKADASSLKGIITDESIAYERKGVDPITGVNRISLIALSNEDWVVPAGPDARRFTVLEVSDQHIEDEGYFRAIAAQLKSGGYEALLDFLLRYDIKGYNPRHHFDTEGLTDQKNQSLQGADAIWFECLYSGKLPSRTADFLKTEDLLDWARRQHDEWKRVRSQQIGLVLGDNKRDKTQGKKKGMGFEKGEPTHDGQRARCWAVPELKEARAIWDAKRYPVQWDDSGDWELIRPVN